MEEESGMEMWKSAHRRSPLLACIVVFVFAAILLGSLPASGQQGPAGSNFETNVDKKAKAAIIDSVIAALDETYVFPEVAEKIEKDLKKRFKKNEYKSLNTLGEFTRKLTEDMEAIAHDTHLWVRPASERDLQEAQIEEPTDEDHAREVARYEYQNYGFEKVERMAGNIGYLKLNTFAGTWSAWETAISAMKFLSYCDALIIDLRENGGGSPSMVQLLSSYFLEYSTHLNSFYIRKTDEMKQFWSLDYVDGVRRPDLPLFVLTSSNTFSAAEGFTYNMKNLERATIIGETTGGGAHPNEQKVFIDLKVRIGVPYGRAVSPITGTNWEGTGIDPHIAVPAPEALDVARLEAMKAVMGKTDDEQKKKGLEFVVKRLQAIQKPAEVDLATLEKYTGSYGPRTLRVEGGALHIQREGGPSYVLIPVSETLFCVEDIEDYMLKVELDEKGDPVALVGILNNGTTDRTPRSK
jgi:hypothetical protein